jgi:hypothetical protein
MFPNQRPMPTPTPFGNGGAPPQQQSPFSQGPFSPNAPSLGPPPPLAPRRPPANAPPAPPQRMAPMGNNMNMNTNMNNMNNMNNNTVQSPLTRSLPQAPLPFDNNVPGGAYVDPSAWTVASNNNGGNNNMNNNVNAGPPGAFGRARARSRSVGSLDRPNPSIFGGPGAGPPSSQFNNPGGSMRAAPGDLARAAVGPPPGAGPAKPLKPPKTNKLPVGATSGEAFGTVSPPPMGSAPIGARSDGAFGVVQPVQPGGSMRLPPTQQQQQKQQQQMGGSVRDFPAGGSLGARNFSQPNIGSQPSAMVRGQISPRGAPQQPQQQPQQPQQLVSGTDQPVERCVCPKCGKLFYFRSDVETHMRLRHT